MEIFGEDILLNILSVWEFVLPLTRGGMYTFLYSKNWARYTVFNFFNSKYTWEVLFPAYEENIFHRRWITILIWPKNQIVSRVTSLPPFSILHRFVNNKDVLMCIASIRLSWKFLMDFCKFKRKFSLFLDPDYILSLYES